MPARATVSVSPSHVEAALTCGLRGVLERRAGGAESTQPQIEGIVVHALVAGLAAGLGADELTRHVDEHLARQTHLPPWQVERSRRALRAMAEAAAALGRRAAEPAGPPSARRWRSPPICRRRTATTDAVRIAGRIDWLDRTADGALVVVDFKTGATVPSKAAVAENAQLGTYQLAIELGGLAADAGAVSTGRRARSGRSAAGGAELVYLRTGRPQLRVQDPPGAGDSTPGASGVREAARAVVELGGDRPGERAMRPMPRPRRAVRCSPPAGR